MFKIECVEGDLFKYAEYNNCHLAHCIGGDFALGAGIAVQFAKRFDMKNKLISEYGSYGNMKKGCILIDNVLNLVTKEHSWGKPTYTDFKFACERMKEIIVLEGITHIATYKLGCTRDKLKWNKVVTILEEVFSDIDITFTIVELPNGIVL